MIAIIGVDGCGKSSVIERLRSDLADIAKSVHVIQSSRKTRHTAVIENHAHPPRSTLVSLLKLGWRAIKWLVQYHFHYHPLLAEGHLVLADRFYFDDILIDPLKYRYAGPVWPLHWLRRLVPRPDVYILLDAHETVLYSRKQEVPLEEVQRQRQAFRHLVKTVPHGYYIDATPPLETVTASTRHVIAQSVHGEQTRVRKG